MADAEKVRLTDDQLLRLKDSGRDDLIGKLNPTELIRMKSLGGAPKPAGKTEVPERPDVELPITASMGPQPPSEGAIPAIFKGLVSTAETMTGVPRGTAGAFKDAAVVLTTAGPYTHWGTPVLEAALRTGTHYADLTAEVP